MNLELIIREILKISRNVNCTYDTLMDLSYKNLEDTNQFLENLQDLDYYFTEEDDLYSNLEIDIVRKLLIFFKKESKYSDDALRGYDKLEERYEELLDEIIDTEIDEFDDFNKDDNLDNDYISDEENMSHGKSDLDSFYEEIPNYVYKYRYIFLNNVYSKAIKNMILSLDNMVPNDMNEKALRRLFGEITLAFYKSDEFFVLFILVFDPWHISAGFSTPFSYTVKAYLQWIVEEKDGVALPKP